MQIIFQLCKRRIFFPWSVFNFVREISKSWKVVGFLRFYTFVLIESFNLITCYRCWKAEALISYWIERNMLLIQNNVHLLNQKCYLFTEGRWRCFERRREGSASTHFLQAYCVALKRNGFLSAFWLILDDSSIFFYFVPVFSVKHKQLKMFRR